MIKSINKDQLKKIILIVLGILCLPILLTLINATMETIFNLGCNLGTYIRTIYETTVC